MWNIYPMKEPAPQSVEQTPAGGGKGRCGAGGQRREADRLGTAKPRRPGDGCRWLFPVFLLLTLSLIITYSSGLGAAQNGIPVSSRLFTAITPTPEAAKEEGALPPPSPETTAQAETGTGQATPLLAGRRICLDPGHDSYWVVGAVGRDRTGRVPVHPTEGIPLHEHELTLRVAYKLKPLLEQEGAEVCVTRKEDGSMQIEPYDFTGDGQVRAAGVALEDGPERTQPRIDWMNRFGAAIAVSIHFNGLDDRTVRGTEVYFSDTGPNADAGRKLAETVLAALVEEMRAAGFPARARGVFSDRYQRYPTAVQERMIRQHAEIVRRNGFNPNNCPDCQRLMVLGNNPMLLTRGQYIGILVEVEFLSNPDAVETFIMRPDSLDLTAAALAKGIIRYYHDP